MLDHVLAGMVHELDVVWWLVKAGSQDNTGSCNLCSADTYLKIWSAPQNQSQKKQYSTFCQRDASVF
jgi:hypothetical protein